jgi:hypothetical protein
MSDERRAEIEAVLREYTALGPNDQRFVAEAILDRLRDARGDDEAGRLSAREVIEALENGYHPQNPTQMHPADLIVKHFKLDGHEGLRDIRSPRGEDQDDEGDKPGFHHYYGLTDDDYRGQMQ